MKKYLTLLLIPVIATAAFAAPSKGDGSQDLEQFIAQQKKQAADKGWGFRRENAEALFAKMDANGDGYATGKERKNYWDEWKKNGGGKPMAQKAATPKPTRKLKRGDATLEMFLEIQKKQADDKGRKFNPDGATALFHKIDADGDGVATGTEKKAYWGN
ncbi:MAG: hypothetical protein SynsKO_21280 [Synoicihabitans sp.]